jgi:hypothetical protein
VKVNRSQQAAQRRLASALGEIGFALPGSLTVRAYRCGKENCRCRGEPPQLHGPYAFWTRKIDGKTVTRMLSDDEVAEYQPLFDNAGKLRALMNELHELSLGLVEPADAGSRPKPGTKPTAAVTRARRSRTTGPQE